MLILDIPYSPVNLILFVGEEEREVFNLKVKHQYPEWGDNPDAEAMTFQNHIFIEDFGIKEILFHEAIHFLEWLYKYMEIEEESEFKACIGSHLINELLKADMEGRE